MLIYYSFTLYSQKVLHLHVSVIITAECYLFVLLVKVSNRNEPLYVNLIETSVANIYISQV